jgi:hypothetical protein
MPDAESQPLRRQGQPQRRRASHSLDRPEDQTRTSRHSVDDSHFRTERSLVRLPGSPGNHSNSHRNNRTNRSSSRRYHNSSKYEVR